MIELLGIVLLCLPMADEPEPSNISGKWVSEEWGIVSLSRSEPGHYVGSFAGGINEVSGSIELQWSQKELRFTGSWHADESCSGKISVRPVEESLEGAWTSNKAARRKFGLPELSEFSWPQADAIPATDQPDVAPMKITEADWLAAEEAGQVAFAGKSITDWLEEFEKSTITQADSVDAESKGISSHEAIQYFQSRPQYDTEIRKRMSTWVLMAEQTDDRIKLARVARAIVRISGSRHQNQTLDHLIRISIKHPEMSFRKFFESYSANDSILAEPFSILELNSELAHRVSQTLRDGNSDQRLAMLILFFGFQRNANDIRFWTHKNSDVLIPALVLASIDKNELVRRYSLNSCHELRDSQIAARLMDVAEKDSSPSNRSCASHWLLHHQEFTPEVLACVTRVIESDAELEVRTEALNHLGLTHPDSQLIHDTLMTWGRSNDSRVMQTAIQLMQQRPAKLQRPMAIDEIIELLSDPEWAMQAQLNLFSLNEHFECVRQYAIAMLGSFEHHAMHALPVLEKETNPATARFARVAIDNIRGYCSDLPLQSLQGRWKFIDGEFPDDLQRFLHFSASEESNKSVMLEITGTELRIGGESVGHISRARSNPEETLCVLIGKDSHRRLTCSVQIEDEPSQAKRRSFSLRLIENPLDFQSQHREESYNFRRTKRQ